MQVKYLLDTNILIYYLNGDEVSIDFIDKNFKKSSISIVTYLEVLSFPYSEDEDCKIREFLELFKIFEMDREVINQAIKIYRIKKIKIADNLIASTAKINNLILITRNIKDFKNTNVKLLNIYNER